MERSEKSNRILAILSLQGRLPSSLRDQFTRIVFKLLCLVALELVQTGSEREPAPQHELGSEIWRAGSAGFWSPIVWILFKLTRSDPSPRNLLIALFLGGERRAEESLGSTQS